VINVPTTNNSCRPQQNEWVVGAVVLQGTSVTTKQKIFSVYGSNGRLLDKVHGLFAAGVVRHSTPGQKHGQTWNDRSRPI
jgi:hypothetical protein